MEKQESLLEACLKWKKKYESSHITNIHGDEELLEAIDREVERQKEVDAKKLLGDEAYQMVYPEKAEQPLPPGVTRGVAKRGPITLEDILEEQKETNLLLAALVKAAYPLENVPVAMLETQQEIRDLLRKLLAKPCHVAIQKDYPMPSDFGRGITPLGNMDKGFGGPVLCNGTSQST